MKKVESVKMINLITENKQKIIKNSFMEKFKSRMKLENLMRKYINGYSKDKTRAKKLQKDYSLRQNSPNNNSYNLFDSNKSINSSNYYIRKNSYLNNSKSLNNTINSRDSNNYNYNPKINKNYESFNKPTYETNNTTHYNKKNSDINDRLTSREKTIRKRNYSFDLTSKELKEKKELEECTFRPKINMYYPTLNNMKYNNFKQNDSFDDQNYRKNIKEKIQIINFILFFL
jgi:hypothetical protein